MMQALRYVLDFQWAHGLSTGVAQILFIASFVGVAIFALLQSRAYVYRGAPDERIWRDLRVWAVLVMALATGLYLYF